MATNRTERRSFTVQVPPTWFEFDVWRATRTSDLARLVDAQIAQDRRLRPWRSALLKALRAAAEQAERQGAVMCAAMCDTTSDGGVLAAVLTVFHTEGDPSPGGNTVHSIAARLTSMETTQGPWRRVQIVDLRSGPAVRVRGVDTVQVGGQTRECVVMHTLVPALDGDGVLDVVLASPQTELADPMLDLFEAISETFAWAADPTAAADQVPPGKERDRDG